MPHGDEVLSSINPAGHGQLVKILISLEPHGIYIYIYIDQILLINFNIVWPLVCKTGTKLC